MLANDTPQSILQCPQKMPCALHPTNSNGATVHLCYVDSSFKYYTWKNCSSSLTVSQVQDAIFKCTDVAAKDQMIFKMSASSSSPTLTKLSSDGSAGVTAGELLFTSSSFVGLKGQLGSHDMSSPSIELVLLNRSIKSEQDVQSLREMQLAAAEYSAFNDFSLSRNVMDYRDLLAGRLPQAHPSQINYETVDISSIFSSSESSNGEITEKFNFEKVRQISTQPTCQSWLNQEGIQLVMLQTVEQLFQSNFSKMKANLRRFRGLSKDCLHELKHFDRIQRVIDALNNHFSGEKSSRPSESSSAQAMVASPSENLQMQMDNL